MVNEQIRKVAEYICALNPTIDAAAYVEQLNILYGAIYELISDSEDYSNELIAIEEERIKTHGTSICKRITNPVMLLMEYSQIAFSLAKKSYLSNEKYAVAPFLKNIISQLFSSELIGEKKRKNFVFLFLKQNWTLVMLPETMLFQVSEWHQSLENHKIGGRYNGTLWKKPE